jgi:phosphonate transport system substrate-binding protein
LFNHFIKLLYLIQILMRYLKKILQLTFICVFFLTLLSACNENLSGVEGKPVEFNSKEVVKEAKQEPARTGRHVIKVSIASIVSPKYMKKYYWALFKLIANRLNLDVEFIQKENFTQVNEMLKQREVDLAFVCSGPYVKGKADFGMEIIAVPVVQGKKVYHAYTITNKNNDITSLGQLRNKIFAFTDPDSNAGCLVTTYYLSKFNETPEIYFKETFFTYSHDNSITAVAEGLVDGASVSSLIWEFINFINPRLTSCTRIIKKSPPYGMSPIVVHPSMEEEKKEKLRTLFFTLHEDPEGKKILDSMLIDRFEPGNDEDYNSIRDMQRQLDAQKS